MSMHMPLGLWYFTQNVFPSTLNPYISIEKILWALWLQYMEQHWVQKVLHTKLLTVTFFNQVPYLFKRSFYWKKNICGYQNDSSSFLEKFEVGKKQVMAFYGEISCFHVNRLSYGDIQWDLCVFSANYESFYWNVSLNLKLNANGQIFSLYDNLVYLLSML